MDYSAKIRFNGSKATEEVVITTDEKKKWDENVFFQFQNVSEIERSKKDNSNGFVVISYKKLR